MKFFLLGSIKDESRLSGPAEVVFHLRSALAATGTKLEFVNTHGIGLAKAFSTFARIAASGGSILNIHSDGHILPMMGLLLTGWIPWVRFVFTLHGIFEVETPPPGRFDPRYRINVLFSRFLIRRAPVLVCVSEMQKRMIAERYGRHRGVHVIHNGVDLRTEGVEPHADEEPLVGVMAGGITRRKDTRRLVELVLALNQPEIILRLQVFGAIEDGELEQWWKTIDKPADRGVRYRGLVDSGTLRSEMRHADIVFCLSNFDTFNLTALQGMEAAALPFVSLQCGASEILADGESAFLFDRTAPDCDAKIASRLRELHADRERLRVLRNKAQQASRGHTWAVKAASYLALE